jgi:anti-sigma regulatory factor (Ser/Thr protein kinase)
MKVAMKISREFDRSIDALEGVFSFVGEQLPESLGERVSYFINLAVEEIFTNMVRHNKSGGDHITVAFEVDAKWIRACLTDYDVEPFDPDSVPEVDTDLPLLERRAGGLGLHMVKSVVDRLVYEYEDRMMRVSFQRNLVPSDVRDQD